MLCACVELPTIVIGKLVWGAGQGTQMIKTQDLTMDGGKISKQVVTRQSLGGGGREVGEWRRRCLAFQQVGGGVQR